MTEEARKSVREGLKNSKGFEAHFVIGYMRSVVKYPTGNPVGEIADLLALYDEAIA